MVKVTRGFSVTTRYGTAEEFVHGFQASCDQRSIFLHTKTTTLVSGEACDFRILLADKTPILRGEGVVVDVVADGIVLGIERIAPDCEAVFAAVVAARTERRTSRMPSLLRPPAQRRPAKPRRIVTLQIPPLGSSPRIPLATPRVATPRVATPWIAPTRTPRSAIELPANPLTNVADASLEGLIDRWLHEDDAEPSAAASSDAPAPIRRARLPRWLAIAAIALVFAAGLTAHTLWPTRVSVSAPNVEAAALPFAGNDDATSPSRAASPRAPSPPVNPAVPPSSTHMVLVHSVPSAARVTYAGRSFGFTPTYVHVPGNTPVTIEIERKGWRPLALQLNSPHPGFRVTVQLIRL